MQTVTRVKVAALAATLVFGVIAAFSLVGASPASAQTLSITSFNIVVTRAPHTITIVDNGSDCVIATPTTNCTANVFNGAVPNADILFGVSLYTLGGHFLLSSIQVHLPDDMNPNCLFLLSGSKLLNSNGTELFLFLGTVGTYSVSNCGLLVGAAIALALGSSPSTAHINAHMTTAHT